MNLAGWMIFSVIWWIAGYFLTWNNQTGPWLVLPTAALPLVGFVRSRRHPRGVVSASGVWAQLAGIFSLAYRFVPAQWLPAVLREWDLIVAWLLAFALSEVIVRLLLWRRRYTPQGE